MIPFHTFLALLALLMLASCSQTPPPHSASALSDQSGLKQNGSGTTPVSNSNNSPTSTTTQANPAPSANSNGTVSAVATATPSDDVNGTTDATSSPGVAKVTLTGVSAKTIYQLMTVQKDTSGLKQGNQFSCEPVKDSYSCNFNFILSEGSVRDVIPLNQVTSGAPDIKQTAQLTGFLKILDPKVGSKVRVWMKEDAAGAIYKGLSISESIVSPPLKGFVSQASKTAPRIDCSKEVPVSHPSQTWYSCYFYLDVANGSVDLVSDDLAFFK